MSKKFLSIIVILCTVICVLIMVFMDDMNLKQNIVGKKVQVMNTDNKKSLEEKSKEKQLTKLDNENVIQEKKLSEIKSHVSSEEYKKNKCDDISKQIELERKQFTEKEVVKENEVTNKEKNSTVIDKKEIDTEKNKDKNNISVFKVSKGSIKDNLTLADKEKLLSVASKLSAVDYEKIKDYLQTGKDEDIVSTIKLLKQRLSDKDYSRVKQVAEKFINMDAVN